MGTEDKVLSLETLQILRRCLVSQQLSVGDPGFAEMSAKAATALKELDAAIVEAGGSADALRVVAEN